MLTVLAGGLGDGAHNVWDYATHSSQQRIGAGIEMPEFRGAKLGVALGGRAATSREGSHSFRGPPSSNQGSREPLGLQMERDPDERH